MKKSRIVIISIAIFIGSAILVTASISDVGNGDRGYVENSSPSNVKSIVTLESQQYPKDKLYVPTQITKIKDAYFIVDCFQHRVIYTDDIKNNIGDWKMIDYEFSGPHTIASDGNVYVVDNAGRNEVLVFDLNFKLIQTIKNVGVRPHKTIYTNNRFYVVSSQTQTIYFYKDIDGKLVEDYHKTLGFLGANYIRSIKMIDEKMYFIFGNNRIVVANYKSKNFEVIEDYTLPDRFAGLIDLEKFNGHFYLTSLGDETYKVSPNIIKSESLSAMSQGIYEESYGEFNLKDKPYFMDIIGDKMFFTEVGEKQNSVLSIDKNNELTVYFRFSELSPGSIKRRDTYPR